MRPSLLKLLVAGCLAGWLLAGTCAPRQASAQSLETREQELADIRRQIDHLRDRVSAMRSRESSLADRLERVTAELELQQARLDEANAALTLASERAAETERRVEGTEVALVEVQGDLRRRLGGLYRLGRHGYMRLFLSMRPGRNLLAAIRQLRYLVQRDRQALDRYASLREDLEVQRAALEAERQQIAEWRGQEKERRDQLLTIRQRRQLLLEEVSAERRQLAARASELENKERKLLRFMDSLVAGGPAPLEGTPIQDFRGVLDWPVIGEVADEFGPRRDPRYRTEVPHNGVDFLTDSGSKVRTVYPGEVLFAADFEGYGPTIVVHHPGRVFTLYAGLRLLNVEAGDVLSLGDVIGACGDRLYFEIRVDNQAQDPRLWLR